MHRCRLTVAFVGIGAWYAARGIVAFVICVLFAVPLGLLIVLDICGGEHAPSRATVSALPPAPPRQPVSLRSPARLAA